MASKLYTAKKKVDDPTGKKKKTTNQSFSSKEDAAQYRKDLKEPITKVARKFPSKKKVSVKLATPAGGFKGVKKTFTDKNGNRHSTEVAMRRANAKLKGKTDTGDFNKKTGRKQD
jgi:hypothetical protein